MRNHVWMIEARDGQRWVPWEFRYTKQRAKRYVKSCNTSEPPRFRVRKYVPAKEDKP